MTRRSEMFLAIVVGAIAYGATGPSSSAGDLTLTPRADGTIVDGDGAGRFDGVPDDADWFFNQSSYEGAITLSPDGANAVEHRVIFEYDLSSLSVTHPVSARLRFQIRGAARFPAEDAEVHIYSYPADGRENLADFDRSPAILEGVIAVAPFAPPTVYVLDVSQSVSEALVAGEGAVGFRMQMAIDTTESADQAFLDANEDDQSTKPQLLLGLQVPGDVDGDDALTQADFAQLAGCMTGPGGLTNFQCAAFDVDGDRDVDARDVRSIVGIQPLLAD